MKSGSRHLLRYGALTLCALLVLPACVEATYISIASGLQTRPVTQGNQTDVQFLVENRGDEAAHNVQVTLIAPPAGRETEPRVLGVLEPQQRRTGQFIIPLPEDMLPGRHPLLLAVEYTDANGYPFQAFSPALLTYEKPSSASISGAIESLEIAEQGSGRTTLTLSNRETAPQSVTVRIHASRELIVTPTTQQVTLEAQSQKDIPLSFKSLGALPGSTYPYIASVTYEHGGLAHATNIVGTVAITRGSGKTTIYVAVFVLLGIVIGFQLRTDKPKRVLSALRRLKITRKR